MYSKGHNNYHTYQNYQPFQTFQNYQPYQNNQAYQPSQNIKPTQSNQTSQDYQIQPTYKIINYRQLQSDEVPGPNFENPDPCLLRVAKSVCKIKIDTNNGTYISGTGFFLRFLINGKFYYWLVK